MSKRGNWLSFNSFIGGEKSDLPPHIIPDDALLGAKNVVTDKTGRMGKRGPISPYLTNTTSTLLKRVGLSKLVVNGAFPSNGYAVSNSGWSTFSLPNPPLYNRAGKISTENSLAAKLNMTGVVDWGPSFNSFGLCSFPFASSNVAPVMYFGSATQDTTTGSSTANITFAANSNQVTINTAYSTNVIGSFIYLANNAISSSTTNEYIGVITNYATVSGSAVLTVYPPAKNALTATGTGRVIIQPYCSLIGQLYESGGGDKIPASATFGCVHQNRTVVLATQTSTFSGSLLGTPTNTQRNVISWSSITGEPATAANTGSDGLLSLLYARWPKSQNVTIDTAGIVGLVSLDANNLLVLCVDKTLLISGQLGTVLPASGVNTSSFNIRTVSSDVGCLDADSIQRTPLGVMFASKDGVYVTDGASFTNVMAGKIQQKWNIYDRSPNYTRNGIVGSAVLNDTHYVVFTLQGPHWVCDLYNDFSWTELTLQNDSNSVIGFLNISDVFSDSDSSIPVASNSSILADSVDAAADVNKRIICSRYYNDSSTFLYPVVFRTTGTSDYPNYIADTMGTAPSDFAVNTDGAAVAIDDSGTHALISGTAPGGASSHVIYLTRSGNTWTKIQTLSAAIATWSGLFRRISIAKSTADRAIVSSYILGKALIIKRTGSTWALEQTITGTSTCGAEVSMDATGTRVLLCWTESGTSNHNWAVWKRAGTVWSAEQSGTLSGSAQRYIIGQAFSDDGLYFSVGFQNVSGAPNEVINYYYNGSTWTTDATVVKSPTVNTSWFGQRIARDKDNIFVSDYTLNTIYWYTRQNNQFVFADYLQFPPPPSSLSGSGNPIAYNNTAKLLVVGAPSNNA